MSNATSYQPNPAAAEAYRTLIEGLGQLPTLPAIVARAMEVLNDPRARAETASHLLSQDPALSFKILRLANSAFYGIPRTISSINQAVMILGFSTIRSLVLSASVFKMFGGGKAAFDRRIFWRHATAAALATRMVARQFSRYRGIDIEAAFMSGLLSKIGILVFDTLLDGRYEAILAEALANKTPLCVLERRELGLDHAALGGLVAEKWGLPDELRLPVQYHLDPAVAGEYAEQAALIHLGSWLCGEVGYPAIEGVVHNELDPVALSTLRWTTADLPLLAESLRAELELAAGFFQLIDAA